MQGSRQLQRLEWRGPREARLQDGWVGGLNSLWGSQSFFEQGRVVIDLG